jgi:N-methylhydantoinase A/oxoprolinase/acetone carboxylase beta subunit
LRHRHRDELIHGSTTAINTLIERKGTKTGTSGQRRSLFESK